MNAAPANPPMPASWLGPLRRSWMSGLTDREIADRHGMDIEAVRAWRHRGGLRPNPARWVDPGPPPNPEPKAPRKPRRTKRQFESLAAANRARHEAATARTVQAAWEILQNNDPQGSGTRRSWTTGDIVYFDDDDSSGRSASSHVPLSAKYRAVLEARVADPWASLAELAATVGLSKDAYAACLRRALLVHAPGLTRP